MQPRCQRVYPLLVSHLVNPRTCSLLFRLLCFRLTHGSQPSPTCLSFEDTSNHNGDTRSQRTTRTSVLHSPSQREHRRPAVRYHVKVLLPLLLLLADIKESRSLTADRRNPRDPELNLYRRPRRRPGPRCLSLILHC